jgi:transcriptional regulator with XRE-family HTH domain
LIQLAKDTNISKSALNNYELGLQIPSAQVIVVLAKYFNVSSDYLLGLKDY